ncbi:uncharacterized protein LOC128262577 [Drosophila gunungcola]|uniref:Uncharacterized protein n=1 Tax=Drosophila gunungcola TaxID=103775 RepID=A0A9Q0BVX4_9MUSC|nr:uncharacterized protein LOC128262577 [Drosophila gunungcola]KAI8045784.1 hypothetical protein M5D96_001973 [Drosophila gunungcola]
MNANIYLNSQHTQLSGRYLNNKVSQQMDTTDGIKRVASNRSLKDSQNVLTISSTIICNCEKSSHKSNGSDSDPNEEIKIKIKANTGNKLAAISKLDASGKDKRALSPRLTLHKSGFQQAIIISDESEVTKSPRLVSQKTGQLTSNSDNQFYRQLTHKISKSEQTSPNNVEMDKANFLYDSNNRSTGCLVYPSDPWIKNSHTKKRLSPKAEKYLNMHHNIDPWVKRQTDGCPVDVSRPMKKNIYREKSLSSINNKLVSTRTEKAMGLKPQLKHSKTELDDDQVFLNEPGLLFAPFSPQHRNTSHKIWSLDQPTVNDLKGNLQSKSASFLPDKVKETSSPLPNHVRKSVYQNNSNLLCPNDQSRSLLQVEKLHSRHSSLSIPAQSKEELPLNIRRLSEQIREPPLEKNTAMSLSDRNVSKIQPSEGIAVGETRFKTNKLQVSRDAAVQSAGGSHPEDFKPLKRAPKDSTTTVNNINPPFTSTYKPDPLLETTC